MSVTRQATILEGPVAYANPDDRCVVCGRGFDGGHAFQLSFTGNRAHPTCVDGICERCGDAILLGEPRRTFEGAEIHINCREDA